MAEARDADREREACAAIADEIAHDANAEALSGATAEDIADAKLARNVAREIARKIRARRQVPRV